jgi:hypothetical protein
MAGGRAGAAPPVEGIVNLHAELTVADDATAAVEETILVWVAGARVNTGIDRDIPTRGASPHGSPGRIDVEELTVTRDGQPERFRVESLADAVRVHIGTERRPLTAGTHVYVLAYRTRWQVAFHADRDELAWHLAGHPRALPIAQASAVVRLPEGAARRMGGLGALADSSGRADPSIVASRRDYAAVFTTTRPIDANDGLTLFVSWPKGVVREPALASRIEHFLRDEWALYLAGALAVIQAIAVWRGARRRSRSFLAVLGLAALMIGVTGPRKIVVPLALALCLLTIVLADLIRAGVRLAGPDGERRYGARARRRRVGAGALMVLALAGLELVGLLAFANLTSAPAALILLVIAGAELALARRTGSRPGRTAG